MIPATVPHSGQESSKGTAPIYEDGIEVPRRTTGTFPRVIGRDDFWGATRSKSRLYGRLHDGSLGHHTIDGEPPQSGPPQHRLRCSDPERNALPPGRAWGAQWPASDPKAPLLMPRRWEPEISGPALIAFCRRSVRFYGFCEGRVRKHRSDLPRTSQRISQVPWISSPHKVTSSVRPPPDACNL